MWWKVVYESEDILVESEDVTIMAGRPNLLKMMYNTANDGG